MFMKKKLTNFQQRALFGTLLTLVIIAAVLLAQHPTLNYCFLFVIALAQAVALWEYYNLAQAKGFHAIRWTAIGFSTAYMTLHFLSHNYSYVSFSSEILFYLLGVVAFLSYFKNFPNSIANLSVTFFGLVYITLPLSLFFNLRYGLSRTSSDDSPLWLLYLIVVTKITDTFAYFIGKQFGKRQLAPTLSPKKTVEGSIGGILGAVAFSLFFLFGVREFNLTLYPQVTFLEIALLGTALAIAGILGDLAESLLKRDAHVKDSNDLPGFGGVLDMVDSVIFTTPLLYLYLRSKLIL
jgi:phosphatidate cytidylyltransferase